MPRRAGQAGRDHRVRLRHLPRRGDRGARGWNRRVRPDTGAPLRLDGEYIRDEDGQAAYLRDLLEIFDAEGVDSAFVFTFALHGYLHRPDGDPRDDLDLASYGIVKVLEDRPGQTYPDMAWEPKAAFTTLADYYRRQAGDGGRHGQGDASRRSNAWLTPSTPTMSTR